MNKNILIVAILCVAILSMGELYRTNIDADYGFYSVRNIDNPSKNFTYVDKTLHINVGDTVEWINNADPDEKLTIDGFEIVDENTFGGIFYHTLRRNYQKYSYNFNKSGKYRIHIDEYPRLMSQTIIVGYATDFKPENLIANPSLVTPVSTPNVVQSIDLQYANETPEIVKITEVPTSIPQSQTIPIKNISGFELIFGICGLIFLSRKL